MEFVRIVFKDNDIAKESKDIFNDLEDFDCMEPDGIFATNTEMTFWAERDTSEDRFLELCHKYPEEELSMIIDDGEGTYHYYDNDNGEYSCWNEEYEVDEEE